MSTYLCIHRYTIHDLSPLTNSLDHGGSVNWAAIVVLAQGPSELQKEPGSQAYHGKFVIPGREVRKLSIKASYIPRSTHTQTQVHISVNMRRGNMYTENVNNTAGVYVYIYVYTYTYIHIYTYMHTNKYVYKYMYVCIYV